MLLPDWKSFIGRRTQIIDIVISITEKAHDKYGAVYEIKILNFTEGMIICLYTIIG